MTENRLAPRLDLWAHLELLGHRSMWGRVTEEEHFGKVIGRIDVPFTDTEYVSQFFAADSLYALTPTDEETARENAGYRPRRLGHFTQPIYSDPEPYFEQREPDDDDRDIEEDPMIEDALDGPLL